MEGFLGRFSHFLQKRDSVREATEQFLKKNPDLLQKINANLDVFILLIRYEELGWILPPLKNSEKYTFQWGIKSYSEIYNELAGSIMLLFQGFYDYANRVLRTIFEMVLRYIVHSKIDVLMLLESDTRIFFSATDYRKGLNFHPNFKKYDSRYKFSPLLLQFYNKLSDKVHGGKPGAGFQEVDFFSSEKCLEFMANLIEFFQYHLILMLLTTPRILQLIPPDNYKSITGGTFSKEELEKVFAGHIQDQVSSLLSKDQLEVISKLHM